MLEKLRYDADAEEDDDKRMTKEGALKSEEEAMDQLHQDMKDAAVEREALQS